MDFETRLARAEADLAALQRQLADVEAELAAARQAIRERRTF